MTKVFNIVKKQFKLIFVLLMIVLIIVINMSGSVALDDETLDPNIKNNREVRQIIEKIEIIHSVFPRQTDEEALFATLVHRGEFTDYAHDSYDPGFSKTQYEDVWSNIASSFDKVISNGFNMAQYLATYIISAVECWFEPEDEDASGYYKEDCVLSKVVSKYADVWEHSTDEDMEAMIKKPQTIDLLMAATIVMLDSSGWVGNYSDDNYKEALAGEGLVGNLIHRDNWASNFVATAYNGIFCTIRNVADIAGSAIGMDNFFQEDDPLALKNDFSNLSGFTSQDKTMMSRLSRYYTMDKICALGFVGGTYDHVQNPDLDTESGREQYQEKKNIVAEEIVNLAEQFRKMSNGGSGNTCVNGSGVCSYKVPGIDEEVSNVKVRTIQSEYGNATGGAGDDIPGEDLIDFEDVYIPGVVYAEVRGMGEGTWKAQAVAARSYALTRGNAMGGALGIGLSIEGGQWVLRIRTSTSDQVYCNVDQGCSSLNGSMQGNLSGAYTVYTGPGPSGNLAIGPLEDRSLVDAVKATRGEIAVDGSGYAVYTGFLSSDQNAWADMIAAGSDYKQAIISHYSGDGVVDVVSNCDNSCGGTGIYSNEQLEEYYQLSQAAVETSNNVSADMAGTEYGSLEGFNNHIKSTINNAGYGTRQGVVAAGVSLIGDYIKATGKKIRYNQSAGYCPGVSTGRQPTGTEGVIDNLYLDCSGFAWWALYNGGFQVPSNAQTDYIYNWAVGAGLIAADNSTGQAGDFLVTRGKGHIMLIIGTYDGGYYIAEESGCGLGGEINKRSFESLSSYALINMDNYYNDSANKR